MSSHLYKNLISSFVFLNLKSNFSSFLTNLRILSPYLDRIIAAIDFHFWKRILAGNENTSTTTRKNILNFQVEETTILNLQKTYADKQQHLPTTYRNQFFIIYFMIVMMSTKLLKLTTFIRDVIKINWDSEVGWIVITTCKTNEWCRVKSGVTLTIPAYLKLSK